jgi:hypothetical protein
MGLDGFSMGNLGLSPEMTSAQMANQAEQIARKESEVKIKDVVKSAEDQEIKRKEKEKEEKNQFDDGFKKNKEDTQENENENQNVLSEKSFENKNPKEFSIRINPQTDLVELFNNKNNKVLETMSANDLMYLISKMDSASGVLFNRKI